MTEARNVSYYDRSLETLERDRLAALQEEKLRALLLEIDHNEHYREKLRAARVDPGSIRGLEDLPRLPFTTKAELVATQERFPPYGKALTYPLARYRYLHQTSGTTGRPLLWLDTEESWQTWLRSWGLVYRGAGVTEEDVVFCAFSFGPFIAHWSSLAGARAIGALALPGSSMSSVERLGKLLAHRATVLLSTPTYALHLAEVAAENAIDLRESDVRVVINAGEPGASVPNVKRAIEEAWGARAFDHAGATEVGAWGFDCETPDHDFHLNELEQIFEVIDPRTGETVADGERGELVITTLGRTGMPVLRYRTGDLGVRTTAPCPCGRSLARLLGGVLGRADDMLIVRGVNVFPSAIDNLVRGIAQIVEYEVEIRTVEAMSELRLRLETAAGSSFDEAKSELLRVFRSQLGIRVDVVSAPAGTLPRYDLKAKRFKRVETPAC